MCVYRAEIAVRRLYDSPPHFIRFIFAIFNYGQVCVPSCGFGHMSECRFHQRPEVSTLGAGMTECSETPDSGAGN